MVRYYHRMGVLPEPPRTSAGYRDYQLSDVALLLKLRTLTDAGIPVSGLHGVLTKNTAVPADIVQDALDNVDEEIVRLQHQRARLVAMHEGTTGVPTDIQVLIDELRQWVTEQAERTDVADGDALIEIFDQDFQGLQLMADAGVATPETWALLRRTLADDRRRTLTLDGLTAWLALASYSRQPVDSPDSPEVARLRDTVIRSVGEGVLSGLTETLLEGDIPLSRSDIPSIGAQTSVLTSLVQHMETLRRAH
jgi:DNA-binding transcriptional MerR regulator